MFKILNLTSRNDKLKCFLLVVLCVPKPHDTIESNDASEVMSGHDIYSRALKSPTNFRPRHVTDGSM